MSETKTSAAVAKKEERSDERVYWLALVLTPALGPTRIRKLIEKFEKARSYIPGIAHRT